MTNQIDYYNKFGEVHGSDILSCPEPEFWTTDYSIKGRVYLEIKHRISKQAELISRNFQKELPVLDIGCGFGRQAVWMARDGYAITGVDSSPVFVELAKSLFKKHNYKGDFICRDLLKQGMKGEYDQLILFDVFEHIPTNRRNKLIQQLAFLGKTGATLIVSLPHLKKRWTSRLNNSIRKGITQYLPFMWKSDEHPYPIPGKKKILKLFSTLFELKYFEETPETDYYVFRRADK